MGALAQALAGLLGNVACAIAPSDEIVLQNRAIRLGDVVRGGCMSPGSENLTVAVLPRGVRRFSLSRRALANLVRRRAPNLSSDAHTNFEGRVVFRLAIAAVSQPPPGPCYAARAALPPGALVTQDALVRTPCAAGRIAARIIYDRDNGAPRAAGAIAEGEYLGPLAAPRGGVDTGAALTLLARSGPVVITRSVRTIQPASHGALVFVRTGDGEILRARLAAGDRGVTP